MHESVVLIAHINLSGISGWLTVNSYSLVFFTRMDFVPKTFLLGNILVVEFSYSVRYLLSELNYNQQYNNTLYKSTFR